MFINISTCEVAGSPAPSNQRTWRSKSSHSNRGHWDARCVKKRPLSPGAISLNDDVIWSGHLQLLEVGKAIHTLARKFHQCPSRQFSAR